MPFKLLRNKVIPAKDHTIEDVEKLFMAAKELSLVECGRGDCLESPIDPECIRTLGYTRGYRFIVRQVSSSKWLIWRKR